MKFYHILQVRFSKRPHLVRENHHTFFLLYMATSVYHYWYQSSIRIHVPIILTSLGPYGWIAGVPWLFACIIILLPFNIILSMTAVSSLNGHYGCSSFCFWLLLLLTAIQVSWELSTHLCQHLLALHVWYPLSLCIPWSLCTFQWHLYSDSFLGSLHLSLHCDGALTPNKLWIVTVLACTGSLYCIDRCAEGSLVTSVTGLLCLSWRLPAMLCDHISCWPHEENSNSGTSLNHMVLLTLIF